MTSRRAGRRIEAVSEGKRIYVQIPAYRDPELRHTLFDLYAKAADPGALRVAVAWQHTRRERLSDPVYRLPGLEIIDIPAARSQGCNWARNLLQRRWRGEPYTLFLDSHHRFAREWDRTVIAMYERLRQRGVAKPILTAYLPSYFPAVDPLGRRHRPYKIYPFHRERGLLTRLTSYPIPYWRSLREPVEANFVSLHFLFVAGDFNRELPFDPSIYFFGDEVATSIRAYLAGYDLFHPHRVLGWHCYDRETRVPHWADHTTWKRQNDLSFARMRQMFGASRTPGAGLRRTVRQYEQRIMMRLVEDRHGP